MDSPSGCTVIAGRAPGVLTYGQWPRQVANRILGLEDIGRWPVKLKIFLRGAIWVGAFHRVLWYQRPSGRGFHGRRRFTGPGAAPLARWRSCQKKGKLLLPFIGGIFVMRSAIRDSSRSRLLQMRKKRILGWRLSSSLRGLAGLVPESKKIIVRSGRVLVFALFALTHLKS